jgi:regulator of sigma E protease
MNAVLAVIFFTAAFMIGVSAMSPVVGGVVPLMPAQKAGILPGDRITAINEAPVESFEDIQTILSSYDVGTAFNVTVERPKPGAAAPERLTFKDLVTQREAGDVSPRLGIEPAAAPVFYDILPGSPEEQAGLKVGDRVLAIDGKPVERWRQMEKRLDEHAPGPVKMEIERDGRRLDLAVVPANLKRLDMGMGAPLLVGGVDPDGPAAKAGIQRGDKILRIDNERWPTADRLIDTLRATGGTRPVQLLLQRAGQTLEIACQPAVYGDLKDARIGIAPVPSMAAPIQVGWVEPDGPAAKAGIEPGDLLLRIGPKAREPRSWEDVAAIIGTAGGNKVQVLVRRGDNERSTTLTPDAKPMEKFLLVGSKPGEILYEPLPRIYNPLKAVARGMKRTWVWMGRAYASILQLAKRQVGTEAVGGPVLIVQASLWVAPHGIGTFMDFWAKLCVFIAVLNFLPIPPFDGGHVLFVILERIKGSPISLKVRTWVWGFGWAAVGLLFALVMWQDIARLIS